jgi:hypothetical protein
VAHGWAIPEARQKLSKLAVIASILTALAGIAVDVISLFMALLSSRGISTPSLQAQGEQRRSSYFNIGQRGLIFVNERGLFESRR